MSFFCLQCGMDMHKPGRICPYCKAVQYEEPSAANMAMPIYRMAGHMAVSPNCMIIRTKNFWLQVFTRMMRHTVWALYRMS